MPNPPAHQKIILSGVLAQASGGGSEIFSMSIAAQSGMSAQALSAACAVPAKASWNAGANNGIPSSASLTLCRVEDINEAGVVTSSYGTPISGAVGVSTNLTPTLCSHCVTLETGTAGNYGSNIRGRFYPPASCSVVGSTALLTAAETYASYWAGLVNGFNDAGAHCCVASTEAGGVLAPVTGVTVDTVIDTIRRRKNHVTGQRTPVVAVTPSS